VVQTNVIAHQRKEDVHGSVAKNILTTFYSWNKSVLATISCVASEFLQQSPFDRDEYLSKLEKPSAEIFTYQHNGLKEC
jgi:hypothetical protein